jgi:hypothetical protein
MAGTWSDAAAPTLAAELRLLSADVRRHNPDVRRAILLAAADRLEAKRAEQHYVLREMSWHEIMRGVEAHDPEAEGAKLLDGPSDMPRDADGDIDLHAKLRVMVPVVSA